MGKMKKWDSETNYGIDASDDEISVVLFVSRKKDNTHIADFKERRVSFVTSRSVEELENQFEAFAKDGKTGECSRMYISVNKRSNRKTKKALLHDLIDAEYSLAALPQRVASLAARKENASERKWLFDFDPIDDFFRFDLDELYSAFMKDLISCYREETSLDLTPTIETHKTPNGYACVVDARFDVRSLLMMWPNVTLKRDDMICCKWMRNE